MVIDMVKLDIIVIVIAVVVVLDVVVFVLVIFVVVFVVVVVVIVIVIVIIVINDYTKQVAVRPFGTSLSANRIKKTCRIQPCRSRGPEIQKKLQTTGENKKEVCEVRAAPGLLKSKTHTHTHASNKNAQKKTKNIKKSVRSRLGI